MARRFRFRLETVRKVRERERDAQRRALAEAIGQVRRIEERIALFSAQLRRMVEECRGAQRRGPLDMASVRGQQFYRGWLQRCILVSDVERTAGKARVDAERARLGEASKRLKVIENLRARQWARHKAEVAREEQAIANETALQVFARERRRESEDRG